MKTKQQRESLGYFRRHARNWRAKAEGAGTNKVNIIEQRNGYVQHVADERTTTRTFLDVGCGTGELICQIAQRGVDSTGVDYAPEMIQLASKKAQDEGVTLAKFVCCSNFDFEIQRESYDLISANGFIEYISYQEMQAFFDVVAEALTPGGSFVLGSRNRLFNLVSMNEFTSQELDTGDVSILFREAIKWTTAEKIVDIPGMECAPLQAPDTKHAKTGVDVATRFQYTPLQLIKLLQERELRMMEVYPVHIHGTPPSFKKTNPDVYESIATLLQTYARYNTKLLPYASTFMLHVKKGE